MAVKPKADPFATAPDQDSVPGGDEAQADIDSTPGAGTKVNPLVVATPEGKVTVTLKGGTGYNAPWVVIHGANVSDALSQINDPEITDLLERAQKASTYFAGKAAAAQGGSQTQSGQPAASVVGTGGAPECKHGPMVLRAGVKNGKAWSGHFCPTPQGTPDQCRPKFSN